MQRCDDRIVMSQSERDVLKVMAAVLQGKRTQAEAARLLRLTVRQVRRIACRLREEGDAGIVHRLRGRPSNRRLTAELRETVLAKYREHFADFGPTLATEKLAQLDLQVSDETLRRWPPRAEPISNHSRATLAVSGRASHASGSRWVLHGEASIRGTNGDEGLGQVRRRQLVDVVAGRLRLALPHPEPVRNC